MINEDEVSELLAGQVIRVYSSDRYTIWCLDIEASFSCYDNDRGITPRVGDLLSFRRSFDGKIAISPRELDESELSERQKSNLVLPLSIPRGGPTQKISVVK